MSDELGQTAPRVIEVDRYRIEKELGSGGFGAVFRARHVHTHQMVALKTLKKQLSGDAQMVERFLREARAAASVGNDHIVKVMDAGVAADGTAFLAMELLEGSDLHVLSQQTTPPSFERLIDLLIQVLEALAAAHQAGIVHRDLKPANVFVTQRKDSRGVERDFVKLLDFGISKFQESLDAPGGITRAGIAMGTPGYMAPEQFFDARSVDGRADLYSVGAMAYQLFSGRLPIEFPNVAELIVRIRSEVPPPLSTLVPGLSPAIAAAVDKALARAPADRFVSALEFAAALRAGVGIRSGGRLATDVGFAAAALWHVPADAQKLIATAPPQTVAAVRVPAPVVNGPVRAALTKGSTLLARAGIRGRAAQTVVALAWLVALLGAGVWLFRARPRSVKGVTHWVLVKSNCPAGSVPARVKTTTSGSRFTSEADGFPRTNGEIRPDGSFTIKARMGGCTGQGDGNTVTQTCGGPFGSCQSTYERDD